MKESQEVYDVNQRVIWIAEEINYAKTFFFKIKKRPTQMRDCKEYPKNDKLLFNFLEVSFSVSFVFFCDFSCSFILLEKNVREYLVLKKNRQSNSSLR